MKTLVVKAVVQIFGYRFFDLNLTKKEWQAQFMSPPPRPTVASP